MKQLLRVCCISTLALTAASCTSVSDIDARFRQLELGADTYIARAGDTLESLAFRYNMSLAQLKALNPGMPNYLSSGVHVNIRAPVSNQNTLPVRTAENSVRRVRDPRLPEANVSTNEAVAVPHPVQRHRAEPIRSPEPESAAQVFAPAINAVVSDMALLGNADPATVRETPLSAEQQQQLPASVIVREVEPYANSQHEEVIEEYRADEPLVVARAAAPSDIRRVVVDNELNDYVGEWYWPTQGHIARDFAPDTQGRHGVDIAGVPGQKVYAVQNGTVAYSGKDPSGAGNLIIVRHADNLLTAYSHARDLYVAEDDTVSAGDPIATLGANARQESVLRFEVRQNGNSLNPMDFLPPR